MEGSRSTVRVPGGEIELRLPLPGLYNVYNALAAVAAALRLGVAPERIATALGEMRAAFGRVETIEVGGVAVSILLIKNPAGANEVLRTLGLEAEREPIDLWIALNDRIADGRDVSWVWDADFELLAGRVRRVVCAGTRAPEMALRLKYAGWPVDSIEVEPAIEASLDRAVAPRPTLEGYGPPRSNARRAAVRAPHLHGAARAAQAARRPRPGEGVLAVSGGARRGGGLARRRVRLLRRRPAALGGAGGGGRRRGARPRLRHRPRRPPPRPPRPPRRRRSTSSRPSWRRCASAPRGLPVETVHADAREFELGRRVPLALAPMQTLQLLDDAADRAACLRRVADHLEPGGRFAASILEEMPEPDGAPPPLPDVREVDGWVYSSLAVEAAVGPGEVVVHRLRQTVSPPASCAKSRTGSGSRPFRRRSSRRRRAAAGLAPVERRTIDPTEIHVGATVVVLGKDG